MGKKFYKIALDLDSVLAETTVLWAREISRRKRKEIRKEDLVSWDLTELVGISDSEKMEIFDLIWSDENWKKIPPTETRLSEKVNMLREYGKVDIVTVRPKNQIENTKRWLAYHKITYDDYRLVPEGMNKSDLDYDIFIDDSPLNARRIMKLGKTIFLYDQPWNRELNGCIRVRTLSEVIRYLNDLAKG